MNAITFSRGIPKGADTCTSPFFTMRIDNRHVRLYVTCIAIYGHKDTNNKAEMSTFTKKNEVMEDF
jgi:hypothetical protein